MELERLLYERVSGGARGGNKLFKSRSINRVHSSFWALARPRCRQLRATALRLLCICSRYGRSARRARSENAGGQDSDFESRGKHGRCEDCQAGQCTLRRQGSQRAARGPARLASRDAAEAKRQQVRARALAALRAAQAAGGAGGDRAAAGTDADEPPAAARPAASVETTPAARARREGDAAADGAEQGVSASGRPGAQGTSKAAAAERPSGSERRKAAADSGTGARCAFLKQPACVLITS